MSMINRIALRSARPAMGMAFRPAPIGLRYLSAPADPKQKANSIIDALPGNNLLSKTGVLATSSRCCHLWYFQWIIYYTR